jgi:uncharacterized protein involved in propanediol utilization
MTRLKGWPEEYRYGVRPKIGRGRSIAQYGELFQGQVEDEKGRQRRCLMSLPCRAMSSEAKFCPGADGVLSVDPPYKKKSLKAVEMTLAYLDAPELGGHLSIESTVPEAKGCGSSTADCIVAAVAVADSINRSLSEEELAKLVVGAEVASDNFMFRRAVLFAHREGVVLEDYAKLLPKIEILGIDTAPEGRVETLQHPPSDYSWRQRQSFCTLAGAMRRAIRKNDIRLLGRVATASACINEHFLPKPKFAEIRRIADLAGALGVGVAHSGTVLSVLLDPSDEFLEKKR